MVRKNYESKSIKNVYTSVINQAELYYGANYSSRRDFNLREIKKLFRIIKILQFDNKSAEIYGELKAKLRQSGNRLKIWI